MFVVPAKAGTQRLENRESHWVPAFAGTTDSGTLNFKASFSISTELVHGISVDRIFPGGQFNGLRNFKINRSVFPLIDASKIGSV